MLWASLVCKGHTSEATPEMSLDSSQFIHHALEALLNAVYKQTTKTCMQAWCALRKFIASRLWISRCSRLTCGANHSAKSVLFLDCKVLKDAVSVFDKRGTFTSVQEMQWLQWGKWTVLERMPIALVSKPKHTVSIQWYYMIPGPTFVCY